jgi:hypothetical protein
MGWGHAEASDPLRCGIWTVRFNACIAAYYVVRYASPMTQQHATQVPEWSSLVLLDSTECTRRPHPFLRTPPNSLSGLEASVRIQRYSLHVRVTRRTRKSPHPHVNRRILLAATVTVGPLRNKAEGARAQDCISMPDYIGPVHMPSASTLKAGTSSTESVAERRRRGEISCAECRRSVSFDLHVSPDLLIKVRRLKMRCDRNVPCKPCIVRPSTHHGNLS